MFSNAPKMVWQIPHKDGVKKKKIYEDEYKIIWEDKQGNQSADLKQKRKIDV